MINTRLILVEGLAGSGKTTIGTFLRDALIQHGVACQFYMEGAAEHPTAVVHRYGVFEPSRYLADAGERWFGFTLRALREPPVTYVLEAALFQDLVTFLVCHDWDPELIAGTVLELCDVIRPLNPVLVDLHQKDIRRHITTTIASRPPGWFTRCVEPLATTEFGQARHLPIEELAVAFAVQVRSILDQLRERCSFPVAEFAMDDRDWEAYRKGILKVLDIP